MKFREKTGPNANEFGPVFVWSYNPQVPNTGKML